MAPLSDGASRSRRLQSFDKLRTTQPPCPQAFPHSAKHNKCVMFPSRLFVVILGAIFSTALHSRLPPGAPRNKERGGLHPWHSYPPKLCRGSSRLFTPSFALQSEARLMPEHTPARPSQERDCSSQAQDKLSLAPFRPSRTPS